ncbi:hypothetical protein [Romeriopsis navalis]|nr:hypothetical protein [Romeriopsis navalis]
MSDLLFGCRLILAPFTQIQKRLKIQPLIFWIGFSLAMGNMVD